MKRYAQLATLVAALRPRTILEIGTHRGASAELMCAALAGEPVHYLGFDVFDTEDARFQAAAMNGKGIATAAEVERRLSRLRNVDVDLIVGDTRKTLHGKRIEADFVFIDGDHRAAVIAEDFLSVASPVVVFDDYWTDCGDVKTPDLAVYGANAVVDRLEHELLPIRDKTSPGWFNQLALVRC